MTRRTIPATSVARAATAAGTSIVPDVLVTGVSDDSRTVEHGDLFFCVRGSSFDGHQLAGAAIAAGAVALMVERHLDVDPSVPQIVVPDVRSAVGPVVSALLGNPSRKLTMIGVTGTNGKTSTVTFTAALLEACGYSPFVIGTLTGTRTTPEPLQLQSLLADAVADSRTHCVMEVSSHAMVLGRVNGITFDSCAFTNLGHDHLDFHGDLEEYFAAKASLFTQDRCRVAVINTDDRHGARLAGETRVRCVGVRAEELTGVSVDAASVSFVWRGHPCTAHAGGAFSVQNLHMALEICASTGVDAALLARAAGTVVAPAGRFESVRTDAGFDVVVDYAHTPEALQSLLESARAVSAGRVVVVFGCGGDRDAAKRPEMGRIAAAHADVVIVTSDNPRSEDPSRIISEIMAGTTSGTAEILSMEDRADAIASAISVAGSGDIVVIAGKGHESHQEVNGQYLRFSDVETARDAVRRKAGNP